MDKEITIDDFRRLFDSAVILAGVLQRIEAVEALFTQIEAAKVVDARKTIGWACVKLSLAEKQGD